MSRENAIQLLLNKAAHNYNRDLPSGLTIDGSAAYMVATKWSPENGIASQRKASLHKNGLAR
jgi:hypothetical protein